MTREEILAQMNSGGDSKEAAKDGERHGALSTGTAKFLSTFTGGGSDYLDMLIQRMKGKDVDVDKIREGYRLDEEASPLASTIGGIAGTAAQALPVGRALQGVGLLSKAPGIVGGIKSGAAIGAGTGLFNEAAYQADRLGSDKKAAEEYSLGGSGLRIGKEAIAGAAGGALGGVVGNVFTKGKGMVANTAKEPLDDAVVRAAMREADDAAKLGMTGPGKMGPEEALRAIKDPAMRHGVADTAAALEGRMAQAGEQYSSAQAPGLLPKEWSRNQFRDDLYSDVATASRNAAGTAKTAADDAAKATATRSGMRDLDLDVTGYWAAQGDPALAAARKALVDQQRALMVAQQRAATPPATVAGANKAAAAKYPIHNVGALEDVIADAATAEPIKAAARQALYTQSPAFKAADDATAAMTAAQAAASGKRAHLDDLSDVMGGGALGRRMSLNQGQPAPTLPGWSPTRIALDLAKAGHDKLSKSAVKQSTDRMIDDPLEEILRQIGRRTKKQRITERAAYPILSGILGNVGITP